MGCRFKQPRRHTELGTIPPNGFEATHPHEKEPVELTVSQEAESLHNPEPFTCRLASSAVLFCLGSTFQGVRP
jgi:hypothetical protein